MTKTIFAAAAVIFCSLMGSAQAATLSGLFDVTAVNVLNRNSTQSQATQKNYSDALTAATAMTVGYAFDTFTYDGDVDFDTQSGATKILGWLSTGGGAVGGLDLAFGNLLLSKGSIITGDATTTFFKFTAKFLIGPSNFTVKHDDGITIYENGGLLGASVGPNSLLTTEVNGFKGGDFDLLYVATNDNPSVLNVDVAPVPLPAAFPLLAACLGGLALMRRRKAA